MIFIHNLSDVSASSIGLGTRIWPFVVILDGAVIGENCNICSHTFIEADVVIGNNVRIHNGARIGQDGFGFAIDETGVLPVPQLGRVVIGDHVNIDPAICGGCGLCGAVCPSGAVQTAYPPADQLLAGAAQLLTYYQDAGGKNIHSHG